MWTLPSKDNVGLALESDYWLSVYTSPSRKACQERKEYTTGISYTCSVHKREGARNARHKQVNRQNQNQVQRASRGDLDRLLQFFFPRISAHTQFHRDFWSHCWRNDCLIITGDTLGGFCSPQDRDALVLSDPGPFRPRLQPLSEEALPGDVSSSPPTGSSTVDPRQPRKPQSHLWAKTCSVFAELLTEHFWLHLPQSVSNCPSALPLGPLQSARHQPQLPPYVVYRREENQQK